MCSDKTGHVDSWPWPDTTAQELVQQAEKAKRELADDASGERKCAGCQHLTRNSISVDEVETPCCGDPWCRKMAEGGKLG